MTLRRTTSTHAGTVAASVFLTACGSADPVGGADIAETAASAAGTASATVEQTTEQQNDQQAAATITDLSAPTSSTAPSSTASSTALSTSASPPVVDPTGLPDAGAAAAAVPTLACGGGYVRAAFLEMTPQQAAGRTAELTRAYPGGTLAAVDTSCAPANTTVMWWGEDGRPTDDLDALFQQRRDSGYGRQVVLALNPRGAWYYQSGLCQLERRQAPPRIGPSTTMDDAAKNWLFEFTSIIAAHGYLHPDAAGVSDIDAEITAGNTAFQSAQQLSPNGWTGPETRSAATAVVCRNDFHDTVTQLAA